MSYRTAQYGPPRFDLSGPVPKDLWVLLGVIFATYSLLALGVQELLYLALGPGLYRGFLWQLVTYPFLGFSGVGGASLWILLELFILYTFGRNVFLKLGRKNFWKLLVYAAVGAAIAAALVEWISAWVTGTAAGVYPSFSLMQGSRMLMVLLIAAFALLNRNATILFMFVLPIPAKVFIYLEIAIAFIFFLGSRDLAGFVGVCAGIGMVWLLLDPRSVGSILKGWRLRAQAKRYQWELDRMKKKRNLRVVRGEGKKGDDDSGTPWVH